MKEGSNGEIPGGVGGHDEAKERPNSVVVKRRYEHRGSAACAEYVCPSSLV